MVTFLQQFDLFLNVLVKKDQLLHEILEVVDIGDRIELGEIRWSSREGDNVTYLLTEFFQFFQENFLFSQPFLFDTPQDLLVSHLEKKLAFTVRPFVRSYVRSVVAGVPVSRAEYLRWICFGPRAHRRCRRHLHAIDSPRHCRYLHYQLCRVTRRRWARNAHRWLAFLHYHDVYHCSLMKREGRLKDTWTSLVCVGRRGRRVKSKRATLLFVSKRNSNEGHRDV